MASVAKIIREIIQQVLRSTPPSLCTLPYLADFLPLLLSFFPSLFSLLLSSSTSSSSLLFSSLPFSPSLSSPPALTILTAQPSPCFYPFRPYPPSLSFIDLLFPHFLPTVGNVTVLIIVGVGYLSSTAVDIFPLLA
ncbi:hypothetical protein BJX96DRAFT_100890 [Aspergillus floccosus]